MNRNHTKAIVATVAALAGTQHALAQFDPYCWPNSATPVGPNSAYAIYSIQTVLFGAAVGLSGTDTYTAVNNIGEVEGFPQYVNCGNETMNMAGRFGFTVGTIGSVQSTIDDSLRLTFGMPAATGNSCGFAMIVTGNPIKTTAFTTVTGEQYGSSNRYFLVDGTAGSVGIVLRVDVVADTARFQWNLTNTSTAIAPIGMMAGSQIVLSQTYPFDHDVEYVYSPGYAPFGLETWWQRTSSVLQFPNTMTFAYTQSDPYGLEVINSSLTSPNIYGINAPDQSPVDEFVIGRGWDILNHDEVPETTNPPNPDWPPSGGTLAPDVPSDEAFVEQPPGFQVQGADNFIDDPAFLQYWHELNVPAGGTRTIVAYYRSTWGVSDYQAPFAAVVDTPLTITTNPSSPSQFTNGTFDFRVYIDNVGGYATAGKLVTLINTKVTVNLPQGMVDATNPTGPNAGTLTKIIPSIAAETMGWIDFEVQVNSTAAPGPNQYTVQINATTGASKTLYGTINVAATPQLTILSNANLVGLPWTFSTSDWGTILGLTPNTQFQAFAWNPNLGQYVVSTNAVRGQGVFVVANANYGTISLGGTPTQASDYLPTDIVYEPLNGQATTLYPGWNLIANPLNYAIPLGQLDAIDVANSNTVQTWQGIVSAGLVSPALAYFDPASQGYEYISQLSDLMLPNQGYWIYLPTQDTLQLLYPAALTPEVRTVSAPWKQSESQWRLQLVAQNGKNVDAQNYIGVAPATVAKTMLSRKPPMAPVSNAISLAIQDTVSGKVTPLAQSMRSTGGNNQTWNVQVTSKSAGAVTLNWPNITTVPSDVQFQLTDTSNGATRDIRMGSGYTYNATAGQVRSFTITAVPGSASRAIISGISASLPRQGGVVSISYVLASNATVSVAILQNGRVIYNAVQGRAASAGTNTATWNLRDAANRAVAPGLYQVQITAEGANGERVYRTFPVTVTR